MSDSPPMETKVLLNNAMYDSWSLLTFLLLILGFKQDCKQIVWPEYICKFKLYENISKCMEGMGFSHAHAFEVLRTEYLIFVFYIATSLVFTLTSFSVFPLFTKLCSHGLFFTLGLYYLTKSEMQLPVSVPLSIALLLYTAIGFYRSFRFKRIGETIADYIVGRSEKRTSFKFFLLAFTHMIFVILRVFIFRFIDYSPSSMTSFLSYHYFLIAELFVIIYTTRFTIGFVYCRVAIPNFRPIRPLELFSLFLASRVAALLKPINMALSLVRRILWWVRITEEEHPILAYFENNRSKVFYAMINSLSYFEASDMSRKYFWRGELRTRLTKIDAVEYIFPLAASSWLILIILFRYLFVCFRVSDLLFMILSHYFFIIEIFHSFAAIDILAPYYDEEQQKLVGRSTAPGTQAEHALCSDRAYDGPHYEVEAHVK